MTFRWQIKFYVCLLKTYFEKGESLTTLPKYAIVTYAAVTQNAKYTISFGFAYVIFCLIAGYFWQGRVLKKEIANNLSVRLKNYMSWQEMENEILNRMNPFVRDMRESIKETIEEKLK